MNISVYGSASGEISDRAREAARELGVIIAKRGHILLTGACPGVPYEAVQGAKEHGGHVVGFSSARSMDEHEKWGEPLEGFDEFVFVPQTYEHAQDRRICKKYRNVSSVTACDSAVFIAGQYGSLNEFTLAYDFGKPIGVVTGTGGVSDILADLVQKIQKEPKPFMKFSDSPEEIIMALENEF